MFSFDVLMFIISSPIPRSIRVWDFVVEIKLLLMESLIDVNQPSSIDGKPYWCQPAIINWWKSLLMPTSHHQLMEILIDANQPSSIDGKPYWCQPAIINWWKALLMPTSHHQLSRSIYGVNISFISYVVLEIRELLWLYYEILWSWRIYNRTRTVPNRYRSLAVPASHNTIIQVFTN